MKTETDFIPYASRDSDGDLVVVLADFQAVESAPALLWGGTRWYGYEAQRTDFDYSGGSPMLDGIPCPMGMAWLWRDHGFDFMGVPLEKPEPAKAADVIFAWACFALVVLAAVLLMR